MGEESVSGARSTAMGQKPGGMGHLPQRKGRADVPETPGNGASGNMGAGGAATASWGAWPALLRSPFSDPPWRAQRAAEATTFELLKPTFEEEDASPSRRVTGAGDGDRVCVAAVIAAECPVGRARVTLGEASSGLADGCHGRVQGKDVSSERRKSPKMQAGQGKTPLQDVRGGSSLGSAYSTAKRRKFRRKEVQNGPLGLRERQSTGCGRSRYRLWDGRTGGRQTYHA